MYDDINVLEYVYQTAKTSLEIIARVINLNIDNNEYINILKDEFNNNKKIASSAFNMLKRRNKEVKEIGIFTKMITYMSVKMNTSENNNEDIINIIIQNLNQVIDELNYKLLENKIKSKSIINLIERYKLFEIETLRRINLSMDMLVKKNSLNSLSHQENI